MKKIGIFLLIGLICITMVACKKQENVGNAEEKKPAQEIVKNPSEPLPLRYQELQDGDGKEVIKDIVDVSVMDIEKKLAYGIKERYNLTSTADEIMNDYQIIKVTGEINSLKYDVFIAEAPTKDFNLYIGEDKVELLGEPFIFSDERLEEAGKSVETIVLIAKKEYIVTNYLQVEIQTYIDDEFSKVFVDVVKE